jgi:hypothetical protein
MAMPSTPEAASMLPEMRAGKHVGFQIANPRHSLIAFEDFKYGPMFEFLFEDGTASPFAVTCALSEFVHHSFPKAGELKHVLVTQGPHPKPGQVPLLALPASTDLQPFDDDDGNPSMTSNSMLITFRDSKMIVTQKDWNTVQ